jgi:hypothetical protein
VIEDSGKERGIEDCSNHRQGKADGKSVVLGPTVTFSQRGAGSLSQTPIAGGPIETRAM